MLFGPEYAALILNVSSPSFPELETLLSRNDTLRGKPHGPHEVGCVGFSAFRYINLRRFTDTQLLFNSDVGYRLGLLIYDPLGTWHIDL